MEWDEIRYQMGKEWTEWTCVDPVRKLDINCRRIPRCARMFMFLCLFPGWKEEKPADITSKEKGETETELWESWRVLRQNFWLSFNLSAPGSCAHFIDSAKLPTPTICPTTSLTFLGERKYPWLLGQSDHYFLWHLFLYKGLATVQVASNIEWLLFRSFRHSSSGLEVCFSDAFIHPILSSSSSISFMNCYHDFEWFMIGISWRDSLWIREQMFQPKEPLADLLVEAREESRISIMR